MLYKSTAYAEVIPLEQSFTDKPALLLVRPQLQRADDVSNKTIDPVASPPLVNPPSDWHPRPMPGQPNIQYF